MKRPSALSLVSGLALGLLAFPALAMPPVMDRVPDDAMLVVVMPSPDSVQKNITALSTAVEYPLPVPSIKDLLGMGGMNAGVDTTKGFAIVVMAPPKGAPGEANNLEETMDKADELAVALLPVTNYTEFLNNFGVKPGAAGAVDSITMNGGQNAFVKDLGGGYVAMSDKQPLLERVNGKAGAASLKAKLGRSGEALADASDVAVIVNMDAVRVYVPQMIEEMKKKAKEQAANMGAQGANVEAQAQVAAWLFETAANDARAVVAGAKTGAMGVALDMAANFTEGSYFGKAFASGGKPGALLGKLPAQDYLLAGAIDTSTAGVRQFITDLVARAAAASDKPDAVKAASAVLTEAEGHAMAVGFPKGGVMAGLLTSTISFTKAKDPAAAVAALRQSIVAMDGQGAQGVSFKSSYTENAAKVGETAVDTWSFRLAGPNDNNQGYAQFMQIIFGSAEGATGYVAKTNEGVYRTYSKNSELLGRALALNAADAMSANKLAGQVAEQLPQNRLAEGYIGTRSILDALTPFIAMTGMPIPMEKVPEQLPPVGVAIASDNGAARFKVFVPAPVIKVGAMIATSVQEQMHQMEDGEAQPDGDKKAGKGTGQPKF